MHSLESRAGWLFPWESRWRAGAWGVHQSLNRCEVLLKYIPNTSEPEVRSSQVSREAGRNCMTYTAPTPESRQRTLWSENHRRLAWLIDWLIDCKPKPHSVSSPAKNIRNYHNWQSTVQSVTFRFRNFSVSKLFQFFGWYRIRYRKNVVSKKVSDSVSKKFGIEKSIGFGIEEIWYRKKVSDSVSFRFWVSSHTAQCITL